MRLALTLGVAVVAFGAMTASAQQSEERREHIVIRGHGAGMGGGDANNDGWLSRDEAAAQADRMFDELDSNDDGRLTSDDRRERMVHFRHPAPPAMPDENDPNCDRTETNEDGHRRVTVVCRTEGGTATDERVIIRRSGDGGTWVERGGAEMPIPPAAPDEDDPNCDRTETNEDGHRRVTVVCRTEGGTATDERVIIRRSGDGGTWVERGGAEMPIPPVPPVAPMAPMAGVFFLELSEDSEADTNGDGALSREEFRAMQLRFFDARDVNGDRRVRAPRPPEPPEAPEAPRAPEPPRRR